MARIEYWVSFEEQGPLGYAKHIAYLQDESANARQAIIRRVNRGNAVSSQVLALN